MSGGTSVVSGGAGLPRIGTVAARVGTDVKRFRWKATYGYYAAAFKAALLTSPAPGMFLDPFLIPRFDGGSADPQIGDPSACRQSDRVKVLQVRLRLSCRNGFVLPVWHRIKLFNTDNPNHVMNLAPSSWLYNPAAPPLYHLGPVSDPYLSTNGNKGVYWWSSPSHKEHRNWVDRADHLLLTQANIALPVEWNPDLNRYGRRGLYYDNAFQVNAIGTQSGRDATFSEVFDVVIPVNRLIEFEASQTGGLPYNFNTKSLNAFTIYTLLGSDPAVMADDELTSIVIEMEVVYVDM